jgi:hypothetical protein
MVMYDEANEATFAPTGLRTPTYRRDGDAFVLNQIPSQDNLQGIECRLVQLPAALVNSTDVIQGLFARIFQELIIYDAASELAAYKLKQTSQEIQFGRKRWHDTMVAVVANALHPTAVSLYSGRMPKNTYSGRIPGVSRTR